MTPNAPGCDAPELRRSASPPPWLFAITNIPFGIAGGYTSVAMPFILHRAGVPMVTIAAVSAAALVPLSWQFLWAPVLDTGLRRRSWLVLTAVLGALLLAASLLLRLPDQLTLFEICCVGGQALTGLVGASNGALIATTVPESAHGRASGWLNAANLGGNALGGGMILGLLDLYSASMAAFALGALTILPALAAFKVPEIPCAPRSLGALFPNTLRDVWATASSRRGWTGILFCLAPVSTPALLDLFSAIGDDFHTTGRTVEFSMGYGSGLATAAGALLSGPLLDRVDRRRAYLVSGVLIALVDLGMAYGPQTPGTYVAGTLIYSLVAGFCFAAFSAIVLDIVATAGRSAAAEYTLFDAAGNLATSYLAWMDGIGYDAFRSRQFSGSTGMLLTDAGMNLAGVLALLLLLYTLHLRGKRTRAAA